MATKLNETSIVEQHVEKGVLGVAVLVLLYVMINWIPSSPRKIGPEGLKPDEIDAYLKAEAIRVQENNDRGAGDIPPDSEKVDYEELTKGLIRADALDGVREMVQIVPPLPPMEDIIPEFVKPTVTLEQIAGAISAPGRPRVKGSLELPRMENEALTDRPTVHVAAVFDRGKLAAEWLKLLKGTQVKVNIAVIAVEAEVRELQPDGTWSQPRPVKGVSLPPADKNGEIYVDDDGNPLTVPTVVQYDGKNKEKVLESIDEISDLFWQEYILQPPYPDIYLPTGEWGTWQVNLPKNEVSDTMKEETISKKFKPGAAAPPVTETPTTKEKPRNRTRTKPPRQSPTAPSKPGSPPLIDPRGAPPVLEPDVLVPPRNMVAASPRLTREAVPLVQPGAAAETKEKKDDAVELKIVPIPGINEQIQEGKLLVLVHDQSIESSKVYQYRVRLVLLNPIYMEEKAVDEDHEKDVFTPSVKTPFSEWSHQVMVPKTTEFFITGKNANNGTVRITVFTRALGQWVSEGFTVKVGQEIGGVQKISVLNPDTGKMEQRKVDFSTGAVITDLDFSAKVPKGAVELATVEMLYIDDSGKLCSRIEFLDSESSRLKQLKQEVERAKATAGGE